MDDKIGLIKYAGEQYKDHGILILNTKFHKKGKIKNPQEVHSVLLWAKGSWDSWLKSYPIYLSTFDYGDNELYVYYIYWSHINLQIGKKYYYKLLNNEHNKWREPSEDHANNWIFENNIWNRYLTPYVGDINIEVPTIGSDNCRNYSGNYNPNCSICNKYLYVESPHIERKILVDNLKEVIEEATTSEKNEFIKDGIDDFITFLNNIRSDSEIFKIKKNINLLRELWYRMCPNTNTEKYELLNRTLNAIEKIEFDSSYNSTVLFVPNDGDNFKIINSILNDYFSRLKVKVKIIY